MNNKELREKILKEVLKDTRIDGFANKVLLTEKTLQLAFAEKDAQKDLFVKKLKEEIPLCWHITVIDKLAKEVFGDE